MAVVGSATPLIAFDAVVIDSETTSLDPAKARIVEIAAVRLTAGRIDSAEPFRRLVRPDEPIPAAAVAVHHIDDGKVAGAPAFEQVWPIGSADRARNRCCRWISSSTCSRCTVTAVCARQSGATRSMPLAASSALPSFWRRPLEVVKAVWDFLAGSEPARGGWI